MLQACPDSHFHKTSVKYSIFNACDGYLMHFFMRVSQTSSCRLHGTQAPFSNIDEGREVACALIYERKMGRETDIKKSEGQGRERKGMTES